MRLWHEKLIPKLPRQQLLGQHRECCALRGAGWNKKHATVDYIFQYSPFKLYQYHTIVMEEMKQRGYQVNSLWEDPCYRGKKCDPYKSCLYNLEKYIPYDEHDNQYLQDCITNLESKNIYINVP